MKYRRCHTRRRYGTRRGRLELGRRPYLAARAARSSFWCPDLASAPGSSSASSSRPPGAVSRPRSLMGEDFMRPAAITAGTWRPGKIVRRELANASREINRAFTPSGRVEMAGVVEGPQHRRAVGVPVDLAQRGHVQVHPVQRGGRGEQGRDDQRLDRRDVGDDEHPLARVVGQHAPPGGGPPGSPSQAACSAGQLCRTSANVRPSQAPKSVSRKPSSVTTGTPVTAAPSLAVAPARCSGDVTITSRRAEARRFAAAAACWMPACVSGTSDRPAYRFCTDMGVCPCLSSRVTVGSPSAGIQADLARTLEAGFGGANEDPPALLAPDYLVRTRRPDLVKVDGVQRQVASLAPARPQHGGAHAAGAADLLVQLEQVGGHLGGDTGAP